MSHRSRKLLGVGLGVSHGSSRLLDAGHGWVSCDNSLQELKPPPGYYYEHKLQPHGRRAAESLALTSD